MTSSGLQSFNVTLCCQWSAHARGWLHSTVAKAEAINLNLDGEDRQAKNALTAKATTSDTHNTFILL